MEHVDHPRTPNWRFEEAFNTTQFHTLTSMRSSSENYYVTPYLPTTQSESNEKLVEIFTWSATAVK
jgi:hypothetical protein